MAILLTNFTDTGVGCRVTYRDGSVIPKFGKKVSNGNGNSNYRNAVEPKKFGKKVSKFLLKDSKKTGKKFSNLW